MKTLFFGGTILSMEEPKPVESLLVEEGRIVALGDLDQVAPFAQGAARVNLEGRTLLPAFVDGHSHITALAQTLTKTSWKRDAIPRRQSWTPSFRIARPWWPTPPGIWVRLTP